MEEYGFVIRRSSVAITFGSPFYNITTVPVIGLDQNLYSVDTSLIHIESRKSPTAVLFDVDTGRISIRHCETKEYHSECSGNILRIMCRTLRYHLSWEFFFEELCASYEVDKYLCSPINETSALAPLTPEETKVDKIVLSWILFTLSDSLRARIVVARPKSAKEAWNLISDIVKDNKRSRTNTLKAELRSIKLGDQSMESYYQKIYSIVNILTSLDARINEEDVVHYAFEGLPDTYNLVCGYMYWKDTFPDLKVVRSLLIAEEIRLKLKVLALPVDSSSPMVLVAETNTNSRSSTSQGKSWKPCFNFAKGSCRFGDSCRYVHDANARVSNANSGFNKGRGTSKNMTNDLLTKLLAQSGRPGMNVAMSNNGTNVTLPNHATVTPTVTGPNIASNVPTAPHAF
ncbi:ribonuclease H-like domain-containing protein [Tanacetum coccineum]